MLPSLPTPGSPADWLRYARSDLALALQRSKHNRIRTHWSHYSREWGESNLWDSWFRMATVARIQCSLDPAALSSWGFIDYPGIGHYSS